VIINWNYAKHLAFLLLKGAGEVILAIGFFAALYALVIIMWAVLTPCGQVAGDVCT